MWVPAVLGLALACWGVLCMKDLFRMRREARRSRFDPRSARRWLVRAALWFWGIMSAGFAGALLEGVSWDLRGVPVSECGTLLLLCLFIGAVCLLTCLAWLSTAVGIRRALAVFRIHGPERRETRGGPHCPPGS